MDSTTVAILGTLAGALVGTTGTLGAQILSGRNAERRAVIARQEERRRARRGELKTAIEAFFFAAEHAQSASDRDVSAAEKRSASDQLWAAFKGLSLVSSEALKDAAGAYSDGLNESLWGSEDAPAWKRIFEQNRNFTAVARKELAAYDS